MGQIRNKFRLRLRRRRLLYRARYKSRELTSISDKTDKILPGDILCFLTVRNEYKRIPYFLKYYRDMGVNHFIFVDNASNDETQEYLRRQDDVSLWRADGSYLKSRFGVDWLNFLLRKYGTGHWCLTLDPDEFFIFPFCDARPLNALTDWLDAAEIKSFGTILLDMYPKGHIGEKTYQLGENPLDYAEWFDAGNYSIKKNSTMGNLWIQGGPRARCFFPDAPKNSPALNKTPLVKWKAHYCYNSSTHNLLPRGLNLVYDQSGGERISGVLLHFKFLSMFDEKLEEAEQHYNQGAEYKKYAEKGGNNANLWCEWSEKYYNWRQLEVIGLMSKGNWI